LADGYATAVYVMGLEGLAWIEKRPGYDAYLITRDNMTHWTAGLDRYRQIPLT
jgi:thiamine biosynthesis lipoprotein ApbE